MWDMIWYLGFPMFAISVFGAPYAGYELDNDSQYDADQFDSIYDMRQNGSENYKFTLDGLSLIWSPNSLAAAAALLEPALHGEYPEDGVDLVLANKPGEKPIFKAESESVKTEVEQLQEKPVDNSGLVPPTVLVIDENQLAQQLQSAAGSRRTMPFPELVRSFLREKIAKATSNKVLRQN